MIKTYTEKEWFAKGESLFGTDKMKWRFQCPMCKKTQSAEELKQFAEKGATPSSAYSHCRGRYTGGKSGPDRCNWASYGLFRGPVTVTHDEGKPTFVFDFAEKEKRRKG